MISSISNSGLNAEVEGLDWCALDELGPAVLVELGLAVMGVMGLPEKFGGARRSTNGVVSAIVLGSNLEVKGPDMCVLVLSLTISAPLRTIDIGTSTPRSARLRAKLALGGWGGTFGVAGLLTGTKLV